MTTTGETTPEPQPDEPQPEGEPGTGEDEQEGEGEEDTEGPQGEVDWSREVASDDRLSDEAKRRITVPYGRP